MYEFNSATMEAVTNQQVSISLVSEVVHHHHLYSQVMTHEPLQSKYMLDMKII